MASSGSAPLIVLFTDFGLEGPYTGQMKAVLRRAAPQSDLIDLFADAPVGNPRAATYLLAAYAGWFPAGTVFLCVVDPGVGGARAPIIVEVDERFYVGPDNGLFELVLRRAASANVFEITAQPEKLSASFHGRDLFAPAAARLAAGDRSQTRALAPLRFADWPDDLGEIVYIDHYGNAMTGLRASALRKEAVLTTPAGRLIRHAETFSAVTPGEGFWYANSNGLIEIAVNLGRADQVLGLAIGNKIGIGR